MIQRSTIAILITILFVLLLILGMLLWLRNLKGEESLEAVNDIILDIRQEYGFRKWQGYDISETARILEETENYYDVHNFTKSAELLEAANATLKKAPLLYPDHTKTLESNPPYGNFIYIPWSSYTPTQEEVIWAAERYDLFILHISRSDFLADIRAVNPDAQIYLYIDMPIQEDEDLLGGGIGQFQWITNNHPDWFLQDSAGRPLFSQEEFGYYWLDPGNTEWQQFFIQKISEKIALSNEQWNGIFLDNIRFRIDNTTYGTPVIANYDSDETFQEATLKFIQNITETLHEENMKVIGNIPQVNVADHPFWNNFLTIADGAMNEVFTRTQYNILEKGYHTTTIWRQQLNQGQTIPQDKILLLMNRVPFWSDKDISLYGYTSMLLGIDTQTRPTYYYAREDAASIPAYWYNEYNVDLGQPTEAARAVDDIYFRRFTNGLIIVNPNPNTQQVTLGDTYINATTNETISSLRLSSHSGAILLQP